MSLQKRLLVSALSAALALLTAVVLKSQTTSSNKEVLTNQDVIELSKAGLSSEIISAKIKTSTCNFDTTPAALKVLKSAGVPDSLILAMVQAAPSLPTVDQIIDKYVQAIGGEQTIRRFTTTVIKGTLTLEGKPGTFEVYAKVPNKFVMTRQLSENSSWKITDGFDGSVGWQSTPQAGVRLTNGQELGVFARSADFYAPLSLKKLYPKMTLRGQQPVGNRPSYLVEADPGDGSLRRMYFDSDTGLLVRNDLEYDTQQGRRVFSWYFEDYRDVDGIKVPFVRRQPNPGADFISTITEIHHDVSVDDSKFAKPEAASQVTSASSQVSSTVAPNTVKALAYRVIPQQRTTYYQSGTNSSSTSCYGQGQFYSFGNFGNMNMSMNCDTTYTSPMQIPITWQFADVYVVVEGSNQLYLIGCRANWRWSNCMPLIVGDMFRVELSGGTMNVTATKNGKKEVHAKYNILQVSPKS